MGKAQDTVGKKLPGELPRDAVHVPVLSARCFEGRTKPGEIYEDEDGRVLGRWDPFVEPKYLVADTWLIQGEWYWVFITPNTIEGVRHDWESDLVPRETKMSYQEMLEKYENSYDNDEENEKWYNEIKKHYPEVMDAMCCWPEW